MSIYGALFAGVSGLSANSVALGIISDNIANVNTVGYKRHQSSFSTLVTGAGSSTFSPGGVRAGNRLLMDNQGLILGSESPTDLAISGDGFFVIFGGADDERGQHARALHARGLVREGRERLPAQRRGLLSLGLARRLGRQRARNALRSHAAAEPQSRVDRRHGRAHDQRHAQRQSAGKPGRLGPGGDLRSHRLWDQHGVRWSDAGFRKLDPDLRLPGRLPHAHLEPAQERDAQSVARRAPCRAAADVTTGAGLIDGQVAMGTIAFTTSGLLDMAATSPSLLNVDFLASGAAPGAGEVAWDHEPRHRRAIGGHQPRHDRELHAIRQPLEPHLLSSERCGVRRARRRARGRKGLRHGAVRQRRATEAFTKSPSPPSSIPPAFRPRTATPISVTNDSGSFNLKIPGDGGRGQDLGLLARKLDGRHRGGVHGAYYNATRLFSGNTYYYDSR